MIYNEIKSNSLGNLKILAHIDNIALLERQYDVPEKYIIARNFNIETKSWDFGSYFRDFQEVLEEFTERVLSSRHIKSSRQKTTEELYELSSKATEMAHNVDRVVYDKNENTKLKVQFIHQKPPLEERNTELYYYDLRDSEIDKGYTIEENVLVNNIGSLVTNQDILKGKPCITDEEFEELDYEEVDNLYNEIEEEMEM